MTSTVARFRVLLFAPAVLALAGCAGKLDYVRPVTLPANVPSNVKVIERSREAVWAAAVPELSKRHFVINNLDKASGLINLGYSGDPERFMDCGRIISYVKNARGERTYDFPAAKAQQQYEIMRPEGLFFLDRRMSLEGRINLIFEEIGPTTTRVTANTRYVVTRTQHVRGVSGPPATRNDSIQFNSRQEASFPSSDAQGNSASCVANGRLEAEILSDIR